MLKTVNKSLSIATLALYAFFSLYAIYVCYREALYLCGSISLKKSGGFYTEYEFNTQATVFIIAIAIILFALTTHIVKCFLKERLALSITNAVLSLLSLIFFITLNTDLAHVYLFRYVFHISLNGMNITDIHSLKLCVTVIVLVSEITCLAFAAAFHIKKRNESSRIQNDNTSD